MYSRLRPEWVALAEVAKVQSPQARGTGFESQLVRWIEYIWHMTVVLVQLAGKNYRNSILLGGSF